MVVLVRRTNHFSNDVKMYRRGDVVTVRGIGANHAIVRINGVNVINTSLAATARRWTSTNKHNDADPDEAPFQRKRYRLDWLNLPVGLRNQLEDPRDGYIQRTWTQAKGLFVRKAFGGRSLRNVDDTDIV